MDKRMILEQRSKMRLKKDVKEGRQKENRNNYDWRFSQYRKILWFFLGT
jgi:hypothetical protein